MAILNKTPAPDRVHPRQLGRYRVLESSGPSAMGEAFRGRDHVGGKDLWIHVLRADRAVDDAFVARLFRRVLAASTIDSQHLAPILDFGTDRGAAFVVVGASPGQSFGELIRVETPIEPNAAAALVVQAARGLQVAHEKGIDHGGLVPDSLVRDEQGIVRIVDLGQAIGPVDREVEAAKQALSGPRQSEKPPIERCSRTDRAADVASLGSILAALIAGGDARENLPLAAIARRMSGSEPSLGEMSEVVSELESFLGIVPGPIVATADRLDLLESSIREFDASPLARQGPLIVAGILGGCLALGLFAILLRLRVLGLGFLTLAVFSALARSLITGLARGSEVVTKLRGLAANRSPTQWLFGLFGIVLISASLAVFGLLKAVIALALAALVIAVGLEIEVDRKLARARLKAIESTRNLLAALRAEGASEGSIRRFFWKFGGERNEPFFAAIFGPNAPSSARRLWGSPRFEPKNPDDWRNLAPRLAEIVAIPVLRLLDDRLSTLRGEHERLQLQPIEERGFEALGINLLTARRRSRRVVSVLLAKTAEIRSRRSPALLASSILTSADDAEANRLDVEVGVPTRRAPAIVSAILGPRARFLSGAILLAGCLAWMHQNEVVPVDAIKAGAVEMAGPRVKAAIQKARPLEFPFLPRSIGHFFRDFTPGVAGALLIVSSASRGWRLALIAVPIAGLILWAGRFFH